MKYRTFDLLDGLQISHFDEDTGTNEKQMSGGVAWMESDIWWGRCLQMGIEPHALIAVHYRAHPTLQNTAPFSHSYSGWNLPLYAFYLMQKSWGAFIMSSVTVTFLRLHKTSLVKVNSFGKSHKECKSQPGRSCLSFVTFADLCKNCPFHGGKDLIFRLEQVICTILRKFKEENIKSILLLLGITYS